MAVFPVIITSTPPASVTITMANYTYAEFLKSLGSFVYQVKKMYLYSTDANQVNQVMLFTKYDSNGDQTYINLTPQINPYQKSNAYLLGTEKDGIVLDSLSRLNFTVLANKSLVLEIFAERKSITEYLNPIAETNYFQVETAFGKKDLFENYTDKL
jgi:hypothetical protein